MDVWTEERDGLWMCFQTVDGYHVLTALLSCCLLVLVGRAQKCITQLSFMIFGTGFSGGRAAASEASPTDSVLVIHHSFFFFFLSFFLFWSALMAFHHGRTDGETGVRTFVMGHVVVQRRRRRREHLTT
ncbi:uncharacterized protein B0T23DRAFT_104351 [Neurospora hispaniola]|uniref:Transmembrane protein n=1 Tax=Neurospora hispaniola TaxID=588809 RepID=A0AAJ0MS19_9PEZI|nr:hypothetical protein B0T23DRAFT_104351 [Neurospora hispaniola]